MFATAPVAELFRTLQFSSGPAPAGAVSSDADWVGTLRVDGPQRGWLEVRLPEALARVSAARVLHLPPDAVDDAVALDGLVGFFERLRTVLRTSFGARVGDPCVAVTATTATPGAETFAVDGHPVRIRFAAG